MGAMKPSAECIVSIVHPQWLPLRIETETGSRKERCAFIYSLDRVTAIHHSANPVDFLSRVQAVV